MASASARPRTALLAGATGLIGRHVLDLLLADPDFDKVVVVGRRSTGVVNSKLVEVMSDFTDLDQALAGVAAKVAFCALGTTIKAAGSQENFRTVDFDAVVNFGQTAKDCGVETMCVVSSVGARATSGNFYLRTKGETETAVGMVGFKSLYVFRPGLLLGARTEFRPAERLFSLPMKLLTPLMVGPLRPYSAIEAKAVAKAMIAAAHAQKPGRQVLTNAQMTAP